MKFKIDLLCAATLCSVFLLTAINVARAEPLEITVDECSEKPGFFFCTPKLDLGQAVQAMQ